MKLWRLTLVQGATRIPDPLLIIAVSAEEALLGVRSPAVEYTYEAEECREIAAYERQILEEQERAEKIKDVEIQAFYAENMRGLRRTLALLKKEECEAM